MKAMTWHSEQEQVSFWMSKAALLVTCRAAPSTALMDTFAGALLSVKESAIIIWKFTTSVYDYLVANWFGVSSPYCVSVGLSVSIAVVLYNRTSLSP